MSDFPAAGYFSDPARTNAEAKAAQDTWLAATKQLPGGAAETANTIVAGVVTPTTSIWSVDTEAAAASDDLTHIATTNIPDGSIVYVHAASAARVVTVKHNAGGAGQIASADVADIVLDATSKWLILKRTGANLEEIGRLGFSASVADGSVTAAKLSSNAVTTAKVADANITDAKLASNAVTTAKVLDTSITYAKIQNVSATARLLGRKTASAGVTEEVSLTEVLDFIGSAAQGDILYRGASSWARLAAGTSGQFLKTLGSGANPAWDAAGSGSPAGMLAPYAGATAPSGWLFAAGQAVSRASYADLFSAIGTAYGAGDGSTTFNVPDLRGRVPAGRDDMGGSAANRITSGGSGITGTSLGSAGGTETHTLTTAQLASHSHSHSHSYTAYTSGGNATPSCGSAGNVGATTSTDATAAGSGNAHQNTQPTIIANYIIKT